VANVFDWLDGVRERPGMYLPDGSLRELETLVHGYYAGLITHGIVEDVPAMTGHFSTWLFLDTGWSTSAGWANAITSHSASRSPLEVFFGLVDRYRKLRPITLRSAKLSKRHAPTGKRVAIGRAGRIERPTSVEIVRYAPTRLHFLRFAYGRRRLDNSILMDGNGSKETSLRFAKRWAADELQTRDDDWKA